jgi:thiamine biosynthesis lipoprotein
MPGGVDPTGLVKGWAAHQVLDLVWATGVEAAMVNAGGDIAVAGRPPGVGDRGWRVGLRDPWDPMRTIATVDVAGAIATSGTYERGDHVIVPATGRPVEGVVSASVTGPDLALADALATGVVAGAEAAVRAIGHLPGYEAFFIRDDRSAVMTDGFPLVQTERVGVR